MHLVNLGTRSSSTCMAREMVLDLNMAELWAGHCLPIQVWHARQRWITKYRRVLFGRLKYLRANQWRLKPRHRDLGRLLTNLDHPPPARTSSSNKTLHTHNTQQRSLSWHLFAAAFPTEHIPHLTRTATRRAVLSRSRLSKTHRRRCSQGTRSTLRANRRHCLRLELGLDRAILWSHSHSLRGWTSTSLCFLLLQRWLGGRTSGCGAEPDCWSTAYVATPALLSASSTSRCVRASCSSSSRFLLSASCPTSCWYWA